MSGDFLILILAGGEGRRIGGGKPLRSLNGETLIARALRIARGWSDDVHVAVRDAGQVGAIDAILLPDEERILGPLGGVAAGLKRARDLRRPALLTMPCDMPLLPADLPDRLSAGIGDACVAIAASGGALHPVCALWRIGALDALPARLACGRLSLRGFADAAGHVVVEWPAEPIDPFCNINDPADLARAEALLGR